MTHRANKIAEPSAAPNVDPAAASGNSESREGPPPVIVRRDWHTIMRCPKCSKEMVPGKAHIGGGFTTAMTGGLSLANLTFEGVQWREHVIQEASDVLPAHYCDNCGAVTLESSRRGLSTLES